MTKKHIDNNSCQILKKINDGKAFSEKKKSKYAVPTYCSPLDRKDYEAFRGSEVGHYEITWVYKCPPIPSDPYKQNPAIEEYDYNKYEYYNRGKNCMCFGHFNTNGNFVTTEDVNPYYGNGSQQSVMNASVFSAS